MEYMFPGGWNSFFKTNNTESDRDRQEQEGTDRDRLSVSEKNRDKTGTKPAKTEQGQIRDKKGQISRDSGDKPIRDKTRTIKNKIIRE